MPEHNVITDPNLHEPKGVSTATAGQIYISDGAGSGSWRTNPSGWGVYQDAAAEQAFNNTAAKLSIDGLGGITNTDYLPLEIRGSGNLWDTTADTITPIAVGDSYEVRLSLPVTSRTSANYAEVQFDIGGGATPTIVVATYRIETSRSAPFNHVVPIPLFALGTFLANGCQIFITTDAGNIGVTAPSIYIQRTHGEPL